MSVPFAQQVRAHLCKAIGRGHGDQSSRQRHGCECRLTHSIVIFLLPPWRVTIACLVPCMVVSMLKATTWASVQAFAHPCDLSASAVVCHDSVLGAIYGEHAQGKDMAVLACAPVQPSYNHRGTSRWHS